MVHAALICHDDTYYLPAVLQSLGDLPATVFINKIPWHGAAGNWKASEKLAKKLKAGVILGEWEDESAQRRATIEWARSKSIQRLLIPDTDEVLSAELLGSLREVATINLADQIHVEMDTYWKSPEYVIRPRERLRPVILIDPRTVEHVNIREYRGQKPLVLPPPHGIMHHLSYAGPEERIVRKLESWSHRNEVVDDWYDQVWRRWDDDRLMRNLHPTHPDCYGYAERIPVPEVLRPAWEAYLQANGGRDPLHPGEITFVGCWPKVSIIIPLYGGVQEIDACLRSLQACQDLFHEVLVVDDKSPDDALDVVGRYPFARSICNAENLGFAATCNRGMEETTGDVAILLNSDTQVPRAGVIRLIETLMSAGSIAAAGPMSNWIGHSQRTRITYLDKQNYARFAEDFACQPIEDTDTDMLVGFCLAVKRHVWNEVGPFDTDFGRGMFEDNDWSYRARRTGYRLAISRRAFVHHEGNASLERSPESMYAIFPRNRRVYEAKWQRDLELGFVSHLPGLENPEPIQFNESRRPEKVERELATLVKQANISLCMIVKNEERVLGDCLASAKPFFTQIIVIDTGSTDRTIEIAKEHGAEVHKFKWIDSFAAARNESMKYAKGRWIFWLDADDTLPWSSGEMIVRAALHAPPQVGGFVVRVRFVTDDPTHGTVVDHVKLFRNYPGLKWEHRIHEQVLRSIRELGGKIGRLPAEILHSGYDTSEEGQARKRERDEKLLALDLKDFPDHPFTLFNVGMTAHYSKDHQRAVEFLQKSITQCQSSESILRKAYALLTVSLRELGRPSEAMAVVEAGLGACPGDPELHFHEGILLSNSGRKIEALRAYERVLGHHIEDHLSSVDIGILGYKSHANMASIYFELGNYAAGKERLQAAIAQREGDLDLVFLLFNAAVRFGDRGTAEENLAIVQRIEGKGPNWQAMVKQVWPKSGN